MKTKSKVDNSDNMVDNVFVPLNAFVKECVRFYESDNRKCKRTAAQGS